MKKLTLLTLLVLTSIIGKAQMYVGQHLNDIKEEYDFGKLEYHAENHNYSYGVTNPDDGTYFMYFLTEGLICYLTVIHPASSGELQAWIQSLNNKWVIVDNTHWRLYRQDGNIMQAESEMVKDIKGPVITFRMIEYAKQQ